MQASTIATILSAISGIMGVCFAITQRPRFQQFVRAVFNASFLVEQNYVLESKLRQVHQDLAEARASLTVAQNTATFNIEQFASLQARITDLEEQGTETGVFIRSAIIYIDALELLMEAHKIDIPSSVVKPVVPRYLREAR